jgi:hypothetical protein
MRSALATFVGAMWLVGQLCGVLCAGAPAASAEASASPHERHASPSTHPMHESAVKCHPQTERAPGSTSSSTLPSERDPDCGGTARCCVGAAETITASAWSTSEAPTRPQFSPLLAPAARAADTMTWANRPARRHLRNPALPVRDLTILQAVFRL